MSKKNRTKGRARKSTTSAVMARDEAVLSLANDLRQGDVFVMPVHPGAAMGRFIESLSEWTIYFDSGVDSILVLTGDWRQASTLDTMSAVVPIGAVMTFPKVPANRTAVESVAGPLPDESDILIPHVEEFTGDEAAFAIPTLFVDSLDVFDPLNAARLRTHMKPRDVQELRR